MLILPSRHARTKSEICNLDTVISLRWQIWNYKAIVISTEIILQDLKWKAIMRLWKHNQSDLLNNKNHITFRCYKLRHSSGDISWNPNLTLNHFQWVDYSNFARHTFFRYLKFSYYPFVTEQSNFMFALLGPGIEPTMFYANSILESFNQPKLISIGLCFFRDLELLKSLMARSTACKTLKV